jgi:type IV pilus assembly protein PilV
MIFVLHAKSRKMRRLRDSGGFTLIEILVAMGILMVGFLGVQSLGIGIVRGNLFSDRTTTATTMAQDKIELIRRLEYRCVGRTDLPGCAVPNGINTGLTTENYNQITNYLFYKRETSIQVDTPSAGMKMATVTVSWGSGTKSVTLTNYLAER